jgi:hypothetical protein
MYESILSKSIDFIHQDIREMMTNPSDQYAAAPLEVRFYLFIYLFIFFHLLI